MGERPVGARRHRAWLLLVLPLAVMGFFFVLPYLNMLYISFLTQPSSGEPYAPPLTLANYARALSDPFNWHVLANTCWWAALTAAIALVLAYPLAYATARARGRVKAWLLVIVLSPLLLDVVIRSYGWMILLADHGLINELLRRLGLRPLRLMYNAFGVIVGLVHVYLPFMVLSLLGSIEGMNPELELAARNLGAGPWRTFWRVLWPLTLPGVFAGTVLVFVLAASSYVIPSLLGENAVMTMPLLIAQRVLTVFNWPSGAALAMFMSVFALGVVWLYASLMNRAMRGLRG
jgi:putative spermidine/putrescine transport system permease protein